MIVFCAAVFTPIGVDYRLTRQYRIEPVNCPAGGVARTRKRSEVNLEGPYKPIYPLKGAWAIPAGTFRDEWVGRNWFIEYFAGEVNGKEVWKKATKKPAS